MSIDLLTSSRPVLEPSGDITERRFRSLMEASLDGMWDWDVEQGSVWLSPRWKAQLGFRDHELPNHFDTLTSRLHPDDVGRVLDQLERFRTSERMIWHSEFRLRHADGAYKHILARGLAERDEAGRLQRLTGIHVDVTKQRSALERVRDLTHHLEARVADRTQELQAARREALAAEERFRAIADYTYNWETWHDEQGKLRYVSPACERITGYRPEEFMADATLMERVVHPEDRDAWRAATAEIPATGASRPIEIRIQARNGALKWIEHGHQVMSGPNGENLGSRGSNRDITERRVQRDQIQAQERLSRAVLDAAQAIVLVLDPEARIVDYNKYMEELSGWPIEEVRGKDWFSTFLPSADHDVIRDKFKAAIETERTRGHVNPIVTRSGELRQIAWYDEIVRDGDGGVALLIVAGHDVTDQIETQSKLRNLNETLEARVEQRTHELRAAQTAMLQSEKLAAIGTLVAGVAHELNNPLMGLFNYVEFARLNPEEPDAQLYLEKAEHELERIRDIVANMMSFTRRSPSAPVDEDLQEPLQRTLDLLAADLRRHGIKVVSELEPAVSRISVPQIQQVFLNLVINAKDAMAAIPVRAERILHCRTGTEGDRVWAEVEDHGPGIPEPTVGRIFDPFFTTKAAGQGTGLGLSMVHELVSAHGGLVQHRPAPERGAIFRIELPAARR